MATIYNSNLSKEIADVAKIQVSSDPIPSQLAEKVVPVIDVNPKHARILNVYKNASAINATSGTIYTTPSTGQDFYLCSACLSMIKDATATSVNSSIVIADGTNTPSILRISGLSLTAQADSIAIAFPFPIKIDRGTTITVQNSTNVGNVTATGCIQGFLVDNVNS